MRLIKDWRGLPPEDQGSALAVGAFDGVHRGHQAVIAGAAKAAGRQGVALGVVTFDPHPRRVFAPATEPFRLMTPVQQARALSHLGVERLYRLPFDGDMIALSAEDFVLKVLVQGLRARHISVGPDFTFGQGRTGSVEALEAYGRDFGFTVSVASLLLDDGEKCSSTAIRAALREGRPERANHMLGRDFAIEGVVIHGDHLGRKIGFPTANIALEDYVRAAEGIYAARARLADGREIPGVAYIGHRPTVHGVDTRLEVNLFDFDEDLYGQILETDLVAFIRGDETFADLDGLIAQMGKDKARAREILMPAF